MGLSSIDAHGHLDAPADTGRAQYIHSHTMLRILSQGIRETLNLSSLIILTPRSEACPFSRFDRPKKRIGGINSLGFAFPQPALH